MAKKQSPKNDVIEKNNGHYSSDNGKNGKEGDLILDKDKLIDVLRLMIRTRTIDNKAMNLLRQGKTFFHIAGSGHEAVQVAAGLYFDPKKDWLFPYYRDLAFVLSIGITPLDFFLQCFAKADDLSGGGR